MTQHEANHQAFLVQQEQARRELQEKLDRCFSRISERNSREIEQMEKAVGTVRNFKGVISRV